VLRMFSMSFSIRQIAYRIKCLGKSPVEILPASSATPGWIATRAHRDEARQIRFSVPGRRSAMSLGSTDQARFTAIHQQQRRLVVGNIRVHRSDHGMSSICSRRAGTNH